MLLVDDTPENLTVLGEILMPHYRVRVASSGQRALTAVVSDPRPDLVLLDVMMPEMDGYEVIRRLRQNPATRELPVIFVTALDSTEDEAHGLELGAVDYITKPVRPAIVLARVRGQLELKEARDRMRDQNLWLESEIARRMRQNQVVQDVSMRALASLAEARDDETGNHILRTQSYVNVLARALAALPRYADTLTPARIETYTKAAPLHDIGKVAIPDHILHKPGKHTPDEWEIMKTHAQQGADAIWRAISDQDEREALDFLYIAMDIARCHHEKWDGSGYPEGLAGEAIPLPARLMALADVFDALISKRVYKPAFPIEKAADIIVQGRGQHFDPDVVDAFIANIDEFAAIAARYADLAEHQAASA
ncbi:Response regulator receiver modulated metal dependent phosphohydrolase [Methyloversatilis universalis FAM5]|uniref:Response regulator receiver modulated metal dependent phosphohydrolase n=1 Tax=Methyloversatilis universalis (strain ATCC BAA-1314 / DSM 25237 / JCM 13912 / CCUG 52030 / FAM5) TaxID=1000565 RepID=F5RG20_METUF|nr:Response regulator receiver modulated metal dependent phosphohydrolase [Methyloversatilis universalis FAM5]